MPTPLYTLRLPADAQTGLVEVGKLCGYSSGRTFAARVLRAVASGDLLQVDAMRAELANRTGVQLGLTLTAPLARTSRSVRRNRSKPTKKNGRRTKLRK